MIFRSEFYSGLVIGLGFSLACASVPTYRYYDLLLPQPCYDHGILFGKQGTSGWPHLPLESCNPDTEENDRCIVQTGEDFWDKDAALKHCEIALGECRKGKS